MPLFFQSTDQYAQRISNYAAPGQDYEEYIGETHPHKQHLTASAVWRIKRIIYDANWIITAILWADRSKEFAFEWNLRATYNYT